jgi:GntR family transcriptional regulator / MocR family aminotransferase
LNEAGKIRLALDEVAAEPLYRQLYHQLRQLIAEGRFEPGARLPSSRLLAAEIGVARITVIQAYKQLSVEGLITIRPGAGSFVSQTTAKISDSAPEAFTPVLTPWGKRLTSGGERAQRPQQQIEIDFGFGRSFPHIFPYDVWRRLLARYLSTDDIMLSRYGSPVGFLPLRRALASYLKSQRGVNCEPEQVVMVSGAQQALDILSRLLLSPGSQVIVENPGFKDAYRIFEAHGVQLAARDVDSQGLPTANLPGDRRTKAVFVTPANQFPHGGTLSLERRLALLQWARHQGVVVIEDDYDSELRYDGRPLGALQGLDRSGQVVYLGTLSKVLFPALRLGYVVLPPALVAPFSEALALVDRGAPTLTQAAVADFIDEGHFLRHLRRLRAAYGERHQTLVDALDRNLAQEVSFSRVPAGLHIMVQLHAACDEDRVVRQAAGAGVGVYPGAQYYVRTPSPAAILLGFTGLNNSQIEEGVERLAGIIPGCKA